MRDGRGREERGFAVIAGAIMVALSLFFAFGAAVVAEHSSLVHTAKLAQERISSKAHERLAVTVTRNPGSTVIEVRNVGSIPSVCVALLIARPMPVGLEAKSINLFVGILENRTITEGRAISDNIGVLTGLGNVFWEGTA
jgi:hypothetical protein